MTGTAEVYRSFGEVSARGTSPVYEDWAVGLSGDAEVLGLVDTLPRARRQPNLVFACARLLGVPVEPWSLVRGWFVAHWDLVAREALTRTTQTNEAGRCATLLPVLASIEGPVALLEVGASAGLCLYPDRYSYRYVDGADGLRGTEGTEGTEGTDGADGAGGTDGIDEVRVDPVDGPSAVELTCRVDDLARVPRRLPDVVWRAGIDLNPLDITDPDDAAWLDVLVWPEHADRRARLAAAATVVAAEPPLLVAGDLLDALPGLAARAPGGATLVVQHSAVLTYVDLAVRERFAALVRDLGAVWLSNEGVGVLPQVAATLPPGTDVGGRFVVARDGEAVALAEQHGRGFAWLR